MKTYIITKIVPNYCKECNENDETTIVFVTTSPTKLIQFVSTLNIDVVTHQQYALYVYENEVELYLNYFTQSFKHNIKNFIKNIR